jgi:AcrR family transcriptional regulator
MGRPRKDPNREPTEQRILNAAVEAFGARGLHGASLADIAAEAGIRRPSLLYHYGTKDALYAAVVKAGFSGLQGAAIKGMTLGETFDERLAGVVVELLGLASRQRSLLQIVVREMVEPSSHASVVADHLDRLVSGLVLFCTTQGEGRLRDDIDLKPAIMTLISQYLLRAASSQLGERLWGGEDRTLSLTKALLLR